MLNPTAPRAIVFRGWSKAERVSGPADSDYSIYLDITFQILMGGSCLADGGKKQAGSDRSGGVQSLASSSKSYVYALVDGRSEAVNGPGLYNRPLYGPHCRDLDSFEERVLAVVGDRPDALVILTNWRVPGGGGCSAAKLGHFFLGLRDAQGGKWFHSLKTIKARYLPGHQDYELQDPSIVGTIRLSYVRPVEFEGLLVLVRLPAGVLASFRRLTNATVSPEGPNQGTAQK